MLICVMMFFSLCWLPMHSYFVIASIWSAIPNLDGIHYVYMACYWLAMTNSAVNPFIYFYMNTRFGASFHLFSPLISTLQCHYPRISIAAFVRSFRMGLMYALRWFPCVRWESGLTFADYLRQLKSGTVMTTTQHYSRGPSNEGDDRLLQVRLIHSGRAGWPSRGVSSVKALVISN